MVNNEILIEKAYEAQQFAYSPYSHYKVGAALLGKDGNIYLGCNIENAAYSPTNCAERTAFFKAVSAGEREFEAIAIVGNQEGKTKAPYCVPCGVCLQVMREFCNPREFKVITVNGMGKYQEFTLAELLPQGFGPEHIGGFDQ